MAGAAKRLTDGEAQGWTVFAASTIPHAEGVEPDDSSMQLPNRRIQRYRVRSGAAAEDIHFAPAGYGDIVASSYAVFRELRDAGTIAPGTRCNLEPAHAARCLSRSTLSSTDVARVLPRFEDAQFADVKSMLARVPHSDFAVQWDVAVEVICSLEGHDPLLAQLYPLEVLADLVARAIDIVPAAVEVGFHLCYGNPGRQAHRGAARSWQHRPAGECDRAESAPAVELGPYAGPDRP